MQRATQTPKRSDIHHSLDYLFTEEALRDSLAGLRGIEEMRVGFAKFVGSIFPDMPRDGVTYYPVLAVFRVPARQRFITFDQYRLEAGVTALIYPMYRVRRVSIRKRVVDSALPACRLWFEDIQSRPRTRKTESFCVYFDQTFDEVVYRPNQSAAANRRPAGQLDGSGNLFATVAADRAFPAAVAELGR
jgi:hypothetical protein